MQEENRLRPCARPHDLATHEAFTRYINMGVWCEPNHFDWLPDTKIMCMSGEQNNQLTNDFSRLRTNRPGGG